MGREKPSGQRHLSEERGGDRRLRRGRRRELEKHMQVEEAGTRPCSQTHLPQRPGSVEGSPVAPSCRQCPL